MENENLQITNLEKKVNSLEKRIIVLENKFSISKSKHVDIKALSINEFILDKKPEDDNQKTLVSGEFLEKYEAMLSFNAKVRSSAFSRVKEKFPSNINDKANQNISKGYMTQLKEKKEKLTAWTLTNKGASFVEQLPAKDK